MVLKYIYITNTATNRAVIQHCTFVLRLNCYRLIILSYDTYITVVFQRSILNLLTQLLKMKQGVNVTALQQK